MGHFCHVREKFNCECFSVIRNKYMKKGGRDAASIPLSSSKGSSSVQVYHDCQMVAFKMHSGNGHALENSSYTGRDQLAQQDGPSNISSSHVISNQEQKYSMRDETVHRNSTWMIDSSSQAYSGPEDDSTDPHETLTETSTLTFVDAHTVEDSAENHGLHGVGLLYLKEFVLIDDDEDGDMSLREKTVTDLSVMDGKAADLVCGRLLSTSSGSISVYKEESSAREAPPTKEDEPVYREKCCFCTLL